MRKKHGKATESYSLAEYQRLKIDGDRCFWNGSQCRHFFITNGMIPSCFPVCQKYMSESGCKFGEKCTFRHKEVDSQPNRKPKEKWWFVSWKNSKQSGCVFQEIEPPKSKSISRKVPNSWDRSAACTSHKVPCATWKFGKDKVHRKVFFSLLNFMSVAFIGQISGRNLATWAMHPQRCAGNGTKCPQVRRKGQRHILLNFRSLVMFDQTQGKRICGRFRSIIAHAEQEDLSSADAVGVSRNLTTVITANGEVQTNEEATVHFRDLEWFAQVIFISVTPMLQKLRIGLKKRRNGKSDVPVKQRGGRPEISSNWRRNMKQHSSHLRKIGACLRHQILNLRKENLLSTPERRCTWSAKRTWILLNWKPWRHREVQRQS